MAARVSSDSTPVKKIATQSTFNECIVNNIPKFSKNSATKPITKPSKKSSNRPSSKRTPPAPIAQPAASPPPRKSIRESKTLPTSPPPRSSHPFGQIIAELDKLNSKVDRMQATLDRTPSVDFRRILHEFQNTFSSKCQEAYQELMQKYQLGDWPKKRHIKGRHYIQCYDPQLKTDFILEYIKEFENSDKRWSVVPTLDKTLDLARESSSNNFEHDSDHDLLHAPSEISLPWPLSPSVKDVQKERAMIMSPEKKATGLRHSNSTANFQLSEINSPASFGSIHLSVTKKREESKTKLRSSRACNQSNTQRSRSTGNLFKKNSYHKIHMYSHLWVFRITSFSEQFWHPIIARSKEKEVRNLSEKEDTSSVAKTARVIRNTLCKEEVEVTMPDKVTTKRGPKKTPARLKSKSKVVKPAKSVKPVSILNNLI